MLYLANLIRAPRVSHVLCDEQDQYIAYNVNEQSSSRPHHGDCHQCIDVYPPNVGKLEKILEGGFIPVIECVRVKKSGKLTLDYVVAAPGTSYTAISHLWADGLGNPDANSIFECQLERIYRAVSDADRAIADYGPRLDKSEKARSTWAESIGTFFRRLSRLEVLRKISRRQTKPIYFWLDVYCVPLDKTLQGVALNRMTTTYSWANYVLVLDHELQLVSSKTEYVEFASRVAVSGWNSRSWTYQEYCMGRTLAFETGDGSRLSDDIGLDGSIGHSLADFHSSNVDEGSGLHFSDLANLIFRPHLATGVRNRGDEKYGEKDRSDNFVRIWNLLRNKTTTKPEDAISIFAMLLDLNPAEVKEISPGGRVKAIAKTFTSLPLDYLFVSPQSEQVGARGDWTPSEPYGSFEIGRLANCGLDTENRLLKIPSSSLYPLNETTLRVLHISNISNIICQVIIDDENGYQRYRLWTPNQGHAVVEGKEAIVLLNQSQPIKLGDGSGVPCNNRACLILAEGANSDAVRVARIYPMLWELHKSSVLSRDGYTYHADDFQIGTRDILIDCDMDSWQELHSRRDLQHAQRASYRSMIAVLLLVTRIIGFTSMVVAPIILLIYLGVTQQLVGSRTAWEISFFVPLGVILAIIVLLASGIYIVAFSQTFYAHCIDYMTMAELSSNFGHSEWWQSKDEVLPKQEHKTVPSQWYFQGVTLTLLRCVVRIAKALHGNRATARDGRRTETSSQGNELNEIPLRSENIEN